jgi:signal transduction histidine kinase
MKTEPQTDKEKGQMKGAPDSFFREINIEFLIHELKDPVAVIETGVRTLLERQEKYGSLTPRQEKILKRALRNTHKARAMLHGLLEVGRSETGCFFCCRFRPVSCTYSVLSDALDAVAGDISEQFRNITDRSAALDFLAGHGIQLSYAPQLETVEMLQDETKFRHVVGNLIKNALYHRSRRIEIRIDRDETCLTLDVRDDGPGIDPAHHQLIFQRYKQLQECALSPRNGHGLGLAGALTIARCLGGDIVIASQKGKGATFRLRLPLVFPGMTD